MTKASALNKSCLSSLPHAITKTHVTQHKEVLTAPAYGQQRERDGACHTDEENQKEVETGLASKE